MIYCTQICSWAPPLPVHLASTITCICTTKAESRGHQQLDYHMWQSRVEIKGYSVAYFNRIAVLRLGLIRTSKMHEYLMNLQSTYESHP